VDILAHPTGRKLKERQAYELDFEQLFQKATETGTILEVNSSPKRLDLKDIHVKMALEHGCQLVVNTDAHHVHDLGNIGLGVATARRGWAEEKDIINTLPLKKLLKLLN
jgi:DNA polymerase (family 10)